MENPVLILGAGNLGKTALDIFERNKVVVYGFLDENEELHQTEIGEVVVLGSPEDEGFTKLIGKKCEAFVAAEGLIERQNLVEMLKERRHVMPVNAIHNTAVIAETAAIGHGNLIGAGAVLNPFVKLGNHCVVNTRVVIDTSAEIGDFAQLGAGSIIGSGVKVEAEAFIGAGAVIVAGVTIGEGAMVGMGSVVVESVPDGARVFGNPAKKV
ncbi:MAG: acetyltransferase [Spirosomataceae bacterium]